MGLGPLLAQSVRPVSPVRAVPQAPVNPFAGLSQVGQAIQGGFEGQRQEQQLARKREVEDRLFQLQQGQVEQRTKETAISQALTKRGQDIQLAGQQARAGKKTGLEAKVDFFRKELEIEKGSEEDKQLLQDLRSSGQTFNIDTKGAGAESQMLGQLRAKKFDKAEADAEFAITQNAELDALEGIEIDDKETGFFANTMLGVSKALTGMGFPESVANSFANAGTLESFRALTQRLVLVEMQKQKGPQTAEDARRIEQSLPSITNVGDTRRFLIRSLRAVNNRKVDRFKFMSDYFEEKGTLKGASKAWLKQDFRRVSKRKDRNVKGLPMFFEDFKDEFRSKNPELAIGDRAFKNLGESEQEDIMIQFWKKQEGIK